MEALDQQNNYDENEEVIEMGRIQKLFGIFVSPINTLKALRNKSDLLLPMLLMPILNLLHLLFIWDGMEALAIQALEKQEMSQELFEQSLKLQKILLPSLAVVGYFIGVAFIAFILWLVNKIVKGELTLKRAWTLEIYGSLIGIFAFIVSGVMFKITGEVPTTQVTSIASLLPADMVGTAVYKLLKPFEIVNIWGTIIIYLGLIHMGKWTKKAAAITSVMMFVLTIGFAFMGWM